MKRKTIEITLKNGQTVTWSADNDEWDDYAYDGSTFILKSHGDWVGFYNMDNVISVVVK